MRCEESLRTRLASFAWRVGMLGCAAALLAGSATAAGQEADYEKLLGDKSPAIVTVKFLLKMKSNWGDHESEQEAPGVMLGSDGLVMCANSHFGGGSWMRSAGVTATPSALKVLIGTDTEGVEATIVARDTELDLAWLRIKEAGDKKFAGIDLQKSAAPVLGERLYCVTRLGKYFDRIAVVGEMRMGGSTTKPRQLYIPSGGNGAAGLPVFNARGELVGVSIAQAPEEEDESGSGGILILPADKAWKATERALATVSGEDEQGEGKRAGEGEVKDENE